METPEIDESRSLWWLSFPNDDEVKCLFVAFVASLTERKA